MEFEFALTIQQTQAVLEKYKKENLILKQMISKLGTDRDTIQEIVNKYSEITDKQTVGIAKLNKRLNELESMNDTKSTHRMKYDFTSNTSNMKEALQNARYLNNNVTHPRNIQPQTKTLMDADMVKNDNKNTAIAGNKGLHMKQTDITWSKSKTNRMMQAMAWRKSKCL